MGLLRALGFMFTFGKFYLNSTDGEKLKELLNFRYIYISS